MKGASKKRSMRTRAIEVFDEIYKRVMSKDLCRRYQAQMRALSADFDEGKAMGLLCRGLPWLVRKKVITLDELKGWFSDEMLSEYNIFTGGKHKIFDEVAVGLGDALIKAEGHCRVSLFERAKSQVFDSSFVCAFDQSEAQVTDCIGHFFDESTGIGRGTAKIEGFDQASLMGYDYTTLIKNEKASAQRLDCAHIVILPTYTKQNSKVI